MNHLKDFYLFCISINIVSINIGCFNCNCLLYSTPTFCQYVDSVPLKDETSNDNYFINNVKVDGNIHINEKKNYNGVSSISMLHPSLKGEAQYNIIFIEDIPCVFIRAEKDLEHNKQKEKKLLVCYHGNGDSAFSDNFLQILDVRIYEEYDVLMPELPGYPGNNEGNFSAEFRNTQQEPIINFAKKYYYGKENKIICHSLGCHFGILLAAKDAELSKKKGEENIFKKLIIACPFYTDKTAAKYIVGSRCCFLNLLVNIFYKCKLENCTNIEKVECDIDILYATNDSVINPKDSKLLYDIKMKQKKENLYSSNIRLRPLFCFDEKKYTEEGLRLVKRIIDIYNYHYKKSINYAILDIIFTIIDEIDDKKIEEFYRKNVLNKKLNATEKEKEKNTIINLKKMNVDERIKYLFKNLLKLDKCKTEKIKKCIEGNDDDDMCFFNSLNDFFLSSEKNKYTHKLNHNDVFVEYGMVNRYILNT